MTARLRLVSIAVAAMCVFALPREAHAQDDGWEEGDNCGRIYYEENTMCDCGEGTGMHSVCASYQDVKGRHQGCPNCYPNPESCHPGCGGSSAFLSASEFAAYAKSLQAAEKGDIKMLLRYGAAAGGFVMYNPHRKAIQIVNCNGGSVRVSLSLPAGALRAVAATNLPDSKSQMAAIAFVAIVRDLRSIPARQSLGVLQAASREGTELVRAASPFGQ